MARRSHSNLNPYPPGTLWYELEELVLAWRVFLRELEVALVPERWRR